MSYSFGKSIVTDGLVYCTDFANTLSYPGSGSSVTDLIGSESTSLFNSPTFITDNSGAMSFDGVNDYMQTTAPVTLLDAPITVDVWARPQTTSSDGTIVGNWGQTHENFLLYWDVGSTPNFRTLIRRSDLTSAATSDSTSCGTANVWNHVCVTGDSSNLKLYLNGVINQTFSFGTPAPRTSGSYNLRVGADSASARNLNGDIGPLKIYNKVLTDAEVLQNYNALKNRFI
jgi:hypothetical protein